ncbi:hypothetical protein AXFE_19290 [Acidithrix ferrooxidans]|uniref:Uncharacterized protein n=1 Tax=Acidithrix ferrooxidans TaxID=1280514 RepID=A0A0D8HJF3_9ACTN|nr:hypothetical protein AXFE_19290 [Acidithrix ferrooxidans]
MVKAKEEREPLALRVRAEKSTTVIYRARIEES